MGDKEAGHALPPHGDGRPIVGIFGKREERGEEKPMSIGLVVVGAKAPVPPKK